MSPEAAPLADTHCHLVLPEFEADRGAVLQRARHAGVTRFLVPGIDLETSRKAVALAEQETDVFAAVGIHPHHAREWNASVGASLRELARSKRVVAIGEIGLDYYRDLSPRQRQREAFLQQLELAGELDLPVVVHIRQSLEDVLSELETWSGSLPPGRAARAGVFHAYSGDAHAVARDPIRGYYIGVAGPLTYRNAGERRRITAQFPLDRLLVETDAPYLPPHPYRGRRNEPAHTRLVAEELSRLLDLPYADVAQATSRNAAALFGWNHGVYHGHLL